MEQTEKARTVTRMQGKRWLAAVLVGLVVLGSAAVAGSAVGKKDSSPFEVGVALPKHSDLQYRIDITLRNGTHTGWIAVDSFSWGVAVPTAGVGGGGATGKAKFEELKITKRLDKFSPMIAEHVALGVHENAVVLEGFARASNGTNVVYLNITLTNVFISGYSVAGEGGGNEMPKESITFDYGKIDFSYVGPDPKDSSTFEYDLSAGESA